MTKDQALALVIELACMTEDRAPEEQRALLDVAVDLDCRLGAFVHSNRALQAPRYVLWAASTYDPSSGRRITLTTEQLRRFGQLKERWALCNECKLPLGAHGAPNIDSVDPRCPTSARDIAWLTDAVAR